MKNRKRNRLAGFDYSSPGVYFLTLCCKNRIHHFGYVENNEMILNECGEIASQQIDWLVHQYPYLLIHNFVVMPNHVHILCEIFIDESDSVGTGRDDVGTGRDDVGTGRDDVETGRNDVGTGRNDVGTGRDLSLRRDIQFKKIKSISELMGAYQTTTSKKIHLAGNLEFKWQRSFYDNIVRNSDAFNQINNYITENPSKWKEDLFHNPISSD